jgi:predicted ATPase
MMSLIENISIRNYGSAYTVSATPINEDLSVIVGPNGAGKSTVLEGTATFGTTDQIGNEALSKYGGNLPQKYPSEIRIATLTIDLSSTRASSLTPLSSRPEIRSLDISENVLRPESDGLIELNSEFASGDGSIKITRYANGTHKIDTNKGRYNIDTLIDRRVEDLEIIGAQLINQAESLGLTDSRSEDERIDITTLSEQFETIENKFEQLDVESEGDSDPTLDELVYADVDAILDHLSKLNQLKGNKFEQLPSINHFEQIPPLTNGISIAQMNEETPYRGLLNLGGINPQNIATLDNGTLESKLESAEEQLTIYLNNLLELEEPAKPSIQKAFTDPIKGRYKAECRIEGEEIHLDIYDNDENTTVPLDRKSTGFQWLVRCILTVFTRTRNIDQTDMFLIDDIGVHLHPDWKIKLRRALHGLTGDSQIVYTTHSPFFINNQKLDQIRVASIDSAGTTLQKVSEIDGSDYVHDMLEPVRSSLGAYVQEFLFGANGILLTEGPTDKDYIRAFSDLLNDNGSNSGLNDDIAIMSGHGGAQIVYANFLEVEQNNYVGLMDNDDAGRGQIKKFEDNSIDSSKYFQLDVLPNQKRSKDSEIEDLFPEELVCEIIADMCKPVVKKSDLVSKVQSSPHKPVLDAIDDRFKRYIGEGDLPDKYSYSKEILCDQLTSKIDESWLTASGEKANTVEDFKYLIQRVNSELH